MGFTLGRALKRKHVTQKLFKQILEERYNHCVSVNTVHGYCSRECPSPHPCWDVVQKCLKEQFGIEYRNGRWQEVNANG